MPDGFFHHLYNMILASGLISVAFAWKAHLPRVRLIFISHKEEVGDKITMTLRN